MIAATRVQAIVTQLYKDFGEPSATRLELFRDFSCRGHQSQPIGERETTTSSRKISTSPV